MGLSPGTKLGPYEILSAAGAGGMGEVYRARDTRLDRTVAIKVLPSHLSSNTELKQRFEREARAISQLQHPHICVLHDVGSENGTGYLVMEYLEGETLAERLGKGHLPLDQLLRIGIEISDALDKAHRSGIIHRDLKPANIMLTKTGAKLMDFGLARGLAGPASAAASAQSGMPGFTATPTMSNPVSPLTGEGTVLGTLNYMSPEQIEGKEADARSDIFAFGCVLYEMATGKRAFEGKSHISVASAILEKEPEPVSALQPTTPLELERIIKTCLHKDPEERLQTAHDLALQLRWIGDAQSRAASVKVSGTWARLAWTVAAICLLALIASTSLIFVRSREKPQSGPRASFALGLPDKMNFRWYDLPVVSPDGSHIVFTGLGEDGSPHLWVRSLDSVNAEMLPGTDGAAFPFWSFDSKSVAFFARESLERIDSSGGQLQSLCKFPSTGAFGTWNSDGVILLGTIGPIYRVSAAGGDVNPVTELDRSRKELWHGFPQFLPDGRHFLFFVASSERSNAGVFVGSLDSKERKRILALDSQASFSPPGYLLYVRGSTLMAQQFDSKRLEVSGEPIPLRQGVMVAPGVGASFSSSKNGVLAYRTAANGSTGSSGQLIWLDEHGNSIGTVGSPAEYSSPSLSRDGETLAIGRLDPQTSTRDIWTFDLKRGTSLRLTFDPADHLNPVWSFDGKQIFFASNRNGRRDFYQRFANGVGTDRLVFASHEMKSLEDLSSDSRYLVYNSGGAGLPSRELWILPLFGDRTPRVFVQGTFRVGGARFSPNGRFIAYRSTESGRSEIYVQSFPEPSGKWQISTDGGEEPQWRQDGRQLFYLGPQKLMAVDVKSDTASFQAAIPKPLFDIPHILVTTARNHYVVSPDGKRFLFVVPSETPQTTVVVNWMAGLKK